QRAEGNLGRIYGIEHVPCDTQMREILDPMSPESLRPLFKRVFIQLQRGKALEPMAFLDGHYLVALDGTGYFSSQTIHCASCLHKVHRNGTTTSYHQMLGPAIIHPYKRAVIPLMPEPIIIQDGTAKNDCERRAAQCLASGRTGQCHRILGDRPGPGPTLQLGNGLAGEQAECLSAHACGPGAVED